MLLLLRVSSRYDTVLAAITLSQLRAGDSSPGHALSEELMRAVLLRIVLRGCADGGDGGCENGCENGCEKDNHIGHTSHHHNDCENGHHDDNHIGCENNHNNHNDHCNNLSMTPPVDHVLRKLLETSDPTLYVALLKQLRLLARQQPLATPLQRLVVDVLLKQLPQLPPFARKPALKTLFLFRSVLPRALPALRPLALQSRDREVSFWATRLLAATALADSESHAEDAAAAIAVVAQLDISLSYRSMLADIVAVAAETKAGDPTMRALVEVAALALLRDGNASLRRAAMKKDALAIPEGVEAAEEREVGAICGEERRARAFCEVCGRILVAFLRTASPEAMAREEEEVGEAMTCDAGV